MEDIQSPMRKNRKREVVSSHQREIIVDAYNNYKLAQNPNIKMHHLKKTLSKELGISKSIIGQTILQYTRSNIVLSPETKIKVSSLKKNLIKRKVYQFWFDQELPTLGKIRQVVNEDEGLPNFSRTSLYRLLESMNFEYVKQGRNSAMVEKILLVHWRRTYLSQIQRYREEGRPIYYLTQTRAKRSNDKRFSLIFKCYTGSEDGFVSKFSFGPRKNTDKMIHEGFRKWLESVLPRLKDHAVIVMNNRSYRSAKQNQCLTINSEKADIIAWFERKGEVVDTSLTIPELIKIINALMPMYERYEIDEIIEAHNKHVLRLPPFHRELNPVTLALSNVKDYTNRKNPKHHNFNQQLIEDVLKVNPDMWKNCIKNVVEEEKKLRNMDFLVDELMPEREPCVLNVTSDDSDSE